MGGKQHRGPLGQRQDALLKQFFGHLHVHRRQRVVQQVNVSFRVERPGQSDPRLLAARKRYALLAHYRIVGVGELVEVGSQVG